jgi:hypothetical protein
MSYTAIAIFSLTVVMISTQVVSCEAAGGQGRASADGQRVVFHPADTPEEQRFALEQLVRHFEDEDPSTWPSALEAGRIKLAEADLNDDGIPERFVMADVNDWCGSAGCKSLLLQKRSGQWYLMGNPTLPEQATLVLKQKKFGYHKLYTGHGISTFKKGKTFEILDLETGEIIR